MIVDLADVRVPEHRQRREFPEKKQKELRESIEKLGMLHPIVVRPLHLTTEENNGRRGGVWMLVAGERRLRVVNALASDKMSYWCNNEEIEPGKVYVTRTIDLDPIELQEAELDENLQRLDLTWQERTAALNGILSLRKAQNPERTVTVAEVAREVSETTDANFNTVRKEMARAEFVQGMMSNPEVAKARTAEEAFKVATRIAESEFTAYLQQKKGETTEHEIICGDCISEMSKLERGVYDVILADPPYGIGADTFGDAGPEHTYADDPETALKIARQIILHGLILAKPSAHLYMFCDSDFFLELRNFAAANGWTTWRTPIIWAKAGGQGHNPVPGQAIRRKFEMILYAYRGDRPALLPMDDVLRDIAQVTEGLHAAEKPVDLYRRLLSRSCKPGDRVLDPCCGVGPVFEAGNVVRARVTGIELNPHFAKIAGERRFKEAKRVELEGL